MMKWNLSEEIELAMRYASGEKPKKQNRRLD